QSRGAFQPDGLTSPLVERLEVAWNDTVASDRRGSADRLFDTRSQPDQHPLRSRSGSDLEGGRQHDPECAERTAEELGDVVAGDVLHHPATGTHDLTWPIHQLPSQQEVPYLAV